MTEYIFPKRIKDRQAVNDCGALLKKQAMQIGLAETETATFNNGEYVILDYGKEMNGGVRILTYLAQGVRIRIRFGESLTECCSDLGGNKNATNDHSLRDFYTELQNYSDMTFGNTGFRFVRLDFYGDTVLKSVIAVNHILRKKAVYRYRGEDKLIRKIYETAKRTVDLCAGQDYLWDGVKRDRLVWIGDSHPEMLALTSLYGRVPVIERSLDFIREQTPLPRWMNNIPMYSMWWIIILADYYEVTGARDYVSKQIPYLKELVNQISNCVRKNGELDYPFYFVDWPTSNQPDEANGVRAINIIAMQKAINLLSLYGKNIKTAQDTLSRLLSKKITVQRSKQVAGLKFLAVGLDEEDKELLVRGDAKGMSTFMSYYILKAVASFDKNRAIEMMKEYYGGMLKKGATSFWEDFDIEWADGSCRTDEYPKVGERDIHGDYGAYCYKGFRHSLCHGWSAGVIQFIKEEC
ncbi:MAG: alpha-L-rhamnosidase [Clostridia bacterium]|nr:alpha-L-rhamnosidase [Clostridia bacterium]